MTVAERSLRAAMAARVPRRPRIKVTASMVAAFERLRLLEHRCRCDGVGRRCPACVEAAAYEESLRQAFGLESWQMVFAPDDGSGHAEDRAAFERYRALQAAARAARRPDQKGCENRRGFASPGSAGNGVDTAGE